MLNDYELLYYYRLNPTNTFLLVENEYRKLMYSAIHQVCFNFKMVCFTVDDAYQEGLISLMAALEGYRNESEATFSSYLYRCVISSTRLLMRKHRSLSFGLLDRAFSLSFPISSDESITLIDVIAEEKAWYQPLMMTNFEELYELTISLIESLDPIEQEVFYLRNDGVSYKEIAEITELTPKKVDNILQKIRRLVRMLME